MMMSDMLQGLDYMHGQKCLHLDIKPDNILIDAVSGRPKLAEFDTLVEQRATMAFVMAAHNMTLRWAAPERMCNDLSKLTAACDIWSCGMVLCEMMTGKEPM